MEDIFKIFADEGIEIPEDKKNNLRSKITKNYKTINEFNDKIKAATEAAETANKTIDDLKAEIAKNTGDLAAANKLIDDYKAADTAREEKAKAEKVTAEYKERFGKVKPADKEFFNEATENWVFEQFRSALSEKDNAGKSDAEVFTAVTKDKDIYKAKNGFRTPPVNNQKHQTTDEAFLAEKYKGNPFFHG